MRSERALFSVPPVSELRCRICRCTGALGRRIGASHDWRWRQLNAGRIEINAAFTEPDDDSNPPPAALAAAPDPDNWDDFVNLTGWPAAVVRVGTSPEGLPIGVQVVGPPWREDRVLAMASELERAFGGWKAPPSVTA